VFRRQEDDPGRPGEYHQAGLELLGGTEPHEAEAEIFAIMAEATRPLSLRAAIGDIGLLRAVIAGLSASPARKAALRRHLWRPRRFRALIDRFAGRAPAPAGRARLLEAVGPAGEAPPAAASPEIGLRSRAEVAARIERLRADAREPALPAREVAVLEQLLALRDTAPAAAEQLRDLAVDLPAMLPAVTRFAARLAALSARGIDIAELDFEASYGRTTLEYYDGFVFGFSAQTRPDLPAIVTGGRYDALTKVLGQGRSCPAVGAAIRVNVACGLARSERVAWP
jgi:ATP phosphoribosyltransferase regulatory subunit